MLLSRRINTLFPIIISIISSDLLRLTLEEDNHDQDPSPDCVPCSATVQDTRLFNYLGGVHALYYSGFSYRIGMLARLGKLLQPYWLGRDMSGFQS